MSLGCGPTTLTSASTVTSLTSSLLSPSALSHKTPAFRLRVTLLQCDLIFTDCTYKDPISKYGPNLKLQAGTNLETLFHPEAPRGGEGGVQGGAHAWDGG